MRGNQPTVIDNDEGEITIELDGEELRGWGYKDDNERRKKMLCAREYVEGWCDALEKYFPETPDQRPQRLPTSTGGNVVKLFVAPSESSREDS